MTRYRRGDVLLLPFPFTDVDTTRRRPAVVVSSEPFMDETVDLIVAMITSRGRPTPLPGDYSLKDWRAAGLIGPSIVRPRVATIHSKRVIRRLGRIASDDMSGINTGLRIALGL